MSWRATSGLRGQILGAVLSASTALAAGGLLLRRGHGGVPLAAAVVSLFLMLLPYFLAGLTDLPQRLGRWMNHRAGRLLGATSLLLVPYVVYAVGTHTFALREALKLVAFVLAPACLVMLGGRRQASRHGEPRRSDAAAGHAASRLAWPDALAILVIWLPLDFRWLRGVWTWPEGRGAYTMNVALAVDLALLLFVAFRRLDDVGYRFQVRRTDLAAFALNFAMCAAIVVPLALATDFVRFDPHTDPVIFAGAFLAIFLTIALPEELLFRGLIQNLLHKTWGHSGRALTATAVIFGLAHLNNGPNPDWRYALLASVAGFFYGRAYLQSHGLMAAALVHASIDAVWRGFFR
jgi:membrane protease YdiL (CAAX protease family)